MAEINFNQLLGQMNPIVRQNYEGVMGGKSFPEQYDPNKRTVNADGTVTDTNSESLTMKDGYTQMVDAYNQEQQIPETGILSTIGSALNPFSKLSASEMPIGQRNQFPGISVGPMSNVERDFPGMSTGDIIDSMQDREYVGPSYEKNFDYLGAGSPMLSKGFQVLSQTPTDPEMSYPYTTGRGNARLSSEQEYGYDPAFGDLVNYTRGPTSFTDRNTFMRDGKLQLINSGPIGYFDDYERVPSLQRALGNERFALAPEELTSQPQELGYVEPATVPKEAIYQDRSMNKNLSNSNYEPKQGILQGLQDKIGAGFNNVKDFAINKGNMGRNLIGSAGAMALGLPGIVGSGAMALMGGLKNQFQDRQLTGDIQDEYGNMYSADELNSQNALGGYYTDPARSARRRTSRIAKMRARDFNNKKISQTNLDRLVRQEKAQQLRDAKDAADRANIQNVQNYTGRELSGYRMSRPASERNYTGGSTNSNPSARGAQDSFSNKSGMGRTGYQEGGLASMFTRRR